MSTTPQDPDRGDVDPQRQRPTPGSPAPTDAGRDTGAGDRTERNVTEQVTKQPAPLTQQVGRVAVVVLAVLFVVFAVANSQAVDFSWLFGSTEVQQTATGETTGGVPLIILLLVAFAVGGLVGSYLEWQFIRSRRARRAVRAGDGIKRRR